MKSIIEQASSIMKAIEKAWNQAEQPKEFSIKIFEKEERNFFGMSTKPAKIGIFFGDKPIIHEKPAPKPRPEIKECRPTQSKTPSSAKPTPEISATASLSGKTSEDFRKSVTDTATEKYGEKSENKSIHRPEDHRKQSQHVAPKQVKQQEQTTHRPTVPAKPAQPVRRNLDEAGAHPQHAVGKKQPTIAADKEEKPRRAPAAWNETMVSSAHNWLKKTLQLMNMSSQGFTAEIAGKNLKLTFSAPLIADVAHEKQLFRSFAHLIMSSLRNQYKQEIKDLKVILIRPEQ